MTNEANGLSCKNKLCDTGEELKNLSLRYEAILAAVPDIIMQVDNNKVYTWANVAGKQFFGEDVIGKEAAHYFEGEQKTYDVVAPVFKGSGDTIYVESWQRRQDGEKRLLAWWCRSVKDSEGNVTGALSTARDITESRKMEAELKDSEARMRTIFELAPDTMYLINRKGEFIDANKAAEELTGYKREEVLGTNLAKANLLPVNQLPKALTLIAKNTLGQPTGPDVFTLKRKDGSRVEIEIKSYPIEINGERAVLGAARDITLRKQEEEETKKHTQEVEKLNDLMVGRELKMVEMKKEIEDLKNKLNTTGRFGRN
jgi:PAS domain S-box-containing protein